MTEGVVVWLTGLPASGKTTLAERIRTRLRRPAVVLDSDVMRDVLGAHRYAPDERDEQYRVLADLAGVLARQSLVVLVAATAPRRDHRERARAAAPHFVEVWVATPLETAAQRDPKGLYARARAGDAPELPGVGVAYEPPTAPDVIATGGHDDAAVDKIVELVGDL
jgi:adenylylsulfate kinase